MRKQRQRQGHEVVGLARGKPVPTDTPCRYLKAYLEAREPGRVALLRFPPGVTLEDAGYDWARLFDWPSNPARPVKTPEPILPGDVLGRLSGLGVEIVASGAMEDIEVGGALREMYIDADPEAYIEDYLDANARLGGERCVTVGEYAMHTLLRATPLRDHMRQRLAKAAPDAVETHGDVAFRASQAPAAASLRIGHLLRRAYSVTAFLHCRLHMKDCESWRLSPARVLGAIGPDYYHRRVPAPIEALRGMKQDRGDAYVAIVRLLIDTLPEEAWISGTGPWGDWSLGEFACDVCVSLASSCEEYDMLYAALKKCQSPREVVRRALDPGWVVARALEAMA